VGGGCKGGMFFSSFLQELSFGRLSGCHFFLVFVRPSCVGGARGDDRCILSMHFLLRA
jgi:hypothetical protein